ncbi:MAG: DUF86 domain-containing protein [Candidatus Delongbacteria bacterium]|nr:DUF86 domain-containing protein [Candidatus Delongbacteria bacterium]MCG2760973.1 DUF86 domain-containing protein [Candidatus Delongbacteria bacterium]
MFNDKLKLEFVLEMIEEIESYKQKYNNSDLMINDRMCFNAILMNLLQIGEALNKLSPETKAKYRNELPVKDIYDTRNFIAHDYGGVRPDIIKDILDIHIALLKKNISDILEK